ncbi:hypothetical protein H4582DRAFT_590874 [Lactarius indigo]|nr:hypothetical protein H4582DRAFT_590874 [Lactarius indigo]
MLEEEESLARDAAIVEHVLVLELDREPLAVVIRPETHVCHKAVLKNPLAVHAHVALGVSNQAHRRLEVDDLPPVVTRPRRPSTATAGRPTWSCAQCDSKRRCAASTLCTFPNPMAADLVQCDSRAQLSRPPRQSSQPLHRTKRTVGLDGFWPALGGMGVRFDRRARNKRNEMMVDALNCLRLRVRSRGISSGERERGFGVTVKSISHDYDSNLPVVAVK